MAKSVCIIGAGPAGLVSAKTLIQTGEFKVTIFEKLHRLGGIWALDEDSKDGFLGPYTQTNLSKFTVSFSDLAWSSVLTEPVPTFPKAWQVNRYLEHYRQTYIPNDILHLDTAVIAARRTSAGWVITTANGQHEFDYLVMASGFFAKPRSMTYNIKSSNSPVQSIHSSQFRSLSDLFPQQVQGNILVIGGGNSAGEAAGVIANQLSNAEWQPRKDDRYKDCKIIHVTPRPIYALPPFVPIDEQYRSYVPLDFHFYNLAKRLPGPIQAGAGVQTKEFRDTLHASVQTSIGSDQADLGAPALVSLNDDIREAAQAALTESYPEFVRSGLIEVIRGRLNSLQPSGDQASAIIGDTIIDNIGAIVYATGYSPIAGLDFLDEQTQKAIQLDPESLRLPMILDPWQTSCSTVPQLAFHGFYEGPYWGMMEMQARITASRWLGKPAIEQRAYESQEKLLALRRAMAGKHSNVPQYWLGDYLGYMEEVSDALNLERNDGLFREREGPSLPSRYLFEGDNKIEADKMMADVYATWNACQAGKFTARAAFRALQGNWDIDRTIDSKNRNYPSGRLLGIAQFHPRTATGDFDFEYLYIESGTFTTAGTTMTASRRYVYRYREANDELSVWFVKPDRDLEVDYLFHNLTISSSKAALVAKADHLCIDDMYETTYTLPMVGIALQTFSIEHVVQGPQKDYIASTNYRRPKPGSPESV